MRRLLVALLLFVATEAAAQERAIVDSAGRLVTLPSEIGQVYPAGPPAAVLLAVLAPQRMAGWPMPLPDAARAMLPAPLSTLPAIPRLTGAAPANAEAVRKTAVHETAASLILDYGTVAPRYAALADDVQRATGLPYLLFDGALTALPATARRIGPLLGAPDKGEALAGLTERLLAQAAEVAKRGPYRVHVARGADGAGAAPADPGHLEVYRLLNVLLAPDAASVIAFDPTLVIVTDPGFFQALPEELRQSRATVVLSPRLPLDSLESPPSVNRLLGLAWLGPALDERWDAAMSQYAETRAALFDLPMSGPEPDGARPIRLER